MHLRIGPLPRPGRIFAFTCEGIVGPPEPSNLPCPGPAGSCLVASPSRSAAVAARPSATAKRAPVRASVLPSPSRRLGMHRPRVILADDHAMFREGLALLL